MRLDVLQLAAICYSGNEYLASGDDSSLVEAQLRTCFRGIDSLEFRKASTHHFASPGAGFIEGTKMWYRRLKSEGVEEIRLHLPISLTSPNPPAWGLVTDGDAGCDIWVPHFARDPGSARSRIEFNAQKFTPWNMRQRMEVGPAFEGLHRAWYSLGQVNIEPEHEVVRVVADELLQLDVKTAEAQGFEDTIPASFTGDRAALCAAAIRAVIAVSSIAESPDDPTCATEKEAIWQQAMRCFEASDRARVAKAA